MGRRTGRYRDCVQPGLFDPATKPDDDPTLAEIYCGTCGCPRSIYDHPCPDCNDKQYSMSAGTLTEGWFMRQAGKKKSRAAKRTDK